jgi:hypothetical protein
MTDNELDPARSTQQFRAFKATEPTPDQVPSGGLPMGLILGVAAVVVIIAIAVIAIMQ